MKISNLLFYKASLPVPVSNTWKIIFIIFSALGFTDATYLAVKYFQHAAPSCSLLNGCDQVTLSAYATIFGIPVALLGALYYALLLILMIGYWDSKKLMLLNLAVVLPFVGFLFSLYLVYLQLFVIHALCLYCLISASTSTLLLFLSLIFFYHQRESRFTTSSTQSPLQL